MGRPQKPGLREPNGRRDRKLLEMEKLLDLEAEQREAVSVALEARIRVFGVDTRTARDQMMGSFIGRLCIMGQKGGAGISQAQYNAAQSYLRDRNAWQRAIGAKPDYEEARPESQGLGDYEDFCRRAKARWADIRSEITDLMVEVNDPAIADSLDKLVVRDLEYWPYVGALRLVLNRLDKFYSAEGRRAA